MKKSRIAILALTPALLCGCAMKCSFADFQKKVGEIDVSGVKQTNIVIKGTFNDGKKDYEVNYDANNHSIEEAVSGLLAVAIMEFNNVAFYAGAEDTNLSYYAGSSFKVKGDGLTITWNKYGACTKIDGKVANDGGSVTAKLTASYTYEKK